MRTQFTTGLAALALLVAAAVAGEAQADPAPAATYPDKAPMAQYRIAAQADEIALARSAAPPSISGAAEVLVLGDAGYETAVKGTNGFVCIVERAWASGFDDPEFWNPKERSPICFNPASVRSVLPTYLQRTKWVLAGVPKADLVTRTKAEITAGHIRSPEAGAMCFMMSKDGYLGDAAGGHWHPHLMFFVPSGGADPSSWGADLPGSPVMASGPDIDPAAVYFVLVPKWSDGTMYMKGM
jgi:hypothetical protein